jgi:diguanylate cyclase (GGDEF)-like protein
MLGSSGFGTPSGEVILATLLAMALSAVLLMLSALVAHRSRQRFSSSPPTVPIACVALAGIALWGPSHWLSGEEPSALRSLLSLGIAMLLAAGSRAAAATVTGPSRRTLVLAVPSVLVPALLHVLVAGPEPFAADAPGPWTYALLVSCLAGLLVMLQHDRMPPRARAFCAATVAAITALLQGTSGAPDPIAWSALWTAAGLAVVGFALMHAVRHEPKRPPQEPRRQPAPISLDGLTKLPTRTDFEERLAAHAEQADRSKTSLALLFIDLDGFKPVNDTFGHSSGDLVLKEVGERLRSISRSNDVLTRIGGDEFVLLAPGSATQEAVAQIAKRIVDCISQPYNIGDREVVISCSIGIVLYPESAPYTKLIARADAAMYEAKRSGGGCYCFYTAAMDDDARDKFDLVSDLRQALDNRELELFYQPKIDARSGQVTAAEALLRWKHPKRGMVSPSVFIPLAERHGLITALGNWVIEDACRQARRWRDRGLRMRVAINLSALQMRQEDIVQRIVGTLEHYRIDPSLLTCEITESVAMEDTRATQATFQRLGEAGVHLSIDDFGTGYSSLGYLRKLPAEELKIDRSFVMDIETSVDARSVVDAVIHLAHALSLKVVAEGVETEKQRDILIGMGCDELQGYLFAKPMSARALLLWASDDDQRQIAFKASLFGETRPMKGKHEEVLARALASTVATSTRPASGSTSTATLERGT